MSLPQCTHLPHFNAFNLERIPGLPRSSYPSSFITFFQFANNSRGSSAANASGRDRISPNNLLASANSSAVKFLFGISMLRYVLPTPAGAYITQGCDPRPPDATRYPDLNRFTFREVFPHGSIGGSRRDPRLCANRSGEPSGHISATNQAWQNRTPPQTRRDPLLFTGEYFEAPAQEFSVVQKGNHKNARTTRVPYHPAAVDLCKFSL